jgi:IS30 family transposase
MTAQIIELRNSKKSIRAIASEVGVSTATVQRELKKVA